MPRPTKDLSGMTFGRWTVIERGEDQIDHNGTRRTTWKCRCECGNERDVVAQSLIRGNSQSCGCLNRELTSVRNRKPNKFIIKDKHVVGVMNNGKEFLFDKDDYDKVSKYTWYTTNGYVSTRDNQQTQIYLHRLVMNNPEGMVVDHINHNPFDCRKNNLRACSIRENVSFQKPKNKYGVVGVSKRKDYDAWTGYILHKGVKYRKTFKTKEEAISWRIKMEKELFGDFSYQKYKEEQ